MTTLGHQPTSGAQPPWWIRMRGPRAITWQSVVGGNALISVAIIATGGTLGGYSVGPHPLDPSVLSRSLTAVVVAGLVAALWAVVGFRVLMPDRRLEPVGLAPFLMYYAVNGAIYFGAVQWLDATAATPSGIGWPARLLSSGALAIAWGIAISLLLDSSDRFHTRRRELLDEMVTAEVERLRESEEALRLREALVASVDDVLASTREQLATVRISSAADVVRSAATDLVRPLSHELHEQAGEAYPSPRLGGILRQWWEHPRMPPLATALLVSTQTTAESVRNFGGVVGPLASLGYVVALYLFLLAVDRVGRRWPRWDRAVYAAGVVGALAMNVWFAEGLSPMPINAGDVLANVGISLVYIVVTSIFDATRQAREGLIEAMERDVDSEELRARALQREMADAVDDLARALHGRVQTRLVVCAAELERAARAGDHDAVARALSEATSALEQAAQPTRASLDDVLRGWSSIIDITLDASEVPASQLQRTDVIAVVEEGLANAFRHGGATTVTVTVGVGPDSLRVQIMDDGSGPSGDASGLGSDVLRQLSHGRAALERRSHHTWLTVDLPA